MTCTYIDYDLHDGFVHNWLVAGPLNLPVKGELSLAAAGIPWGRLRWLKMSRSGSR